MKKVLIVGRLLVSQLDHVNLVEIDHEIFSAVIIPLPEIEEEQLSVTGESTCTRTG